MFQFHFCINNEGYKGGRRIQVTSETAKGEGYFARRPRDNATPGTFVSRFSVVSSDRLPHGVQILKPTILTSRIEQCRIFLHKENAETYRIEAFQLIL